MRIKAILIKRNIKFNWTHNLRNLIGNLPSEYDIPKFVYESTKLTDYAVSMRYPGDYEEITEDEYHVLQLCKGITLRDNSKCVAVVRARLRSGVERTCSLQSLPETMYQVRLQIGNTVKNCVFSKETDLFFIDREDKILMVKTFDPVYPSGCKKADLNELGVKDLSFLFNAFVVK